MSSPAPTVSPSLQARLNGLPARAVIFGSALGAALVSLCLFTPRFWLWRGLGAPRSDLISLEPEFNRAFFALQQIANPWLKIDDATNRVIEWRLFWPIVAHYLHLPASLYLALPHVGALLALGAVASIAWRATHEASATFGATLLAATSSWFFVSAGWLAYFDSWLMLALLGASFAVSRRTLFVVALFAPWIDERFILALPLCLGVRTFGIGGPRRELRGLLRDMGALVAGVAPYLVIRLGMEFSHTRETSAVYWNQRSVMPAPLGGMLAGTWHGLRFGWLPFAAWFVIVIRHPGGWIAASLALVTVGLNLCVADDLSRSCSVALPAMLAGALLVWRSETVFQRRGLLIACTGNLLLPASHVIATPTRETEAWHNVPILYLYAEVEHAQNPPTYASPSAYNERGLAAFNAGDTARALRNFEIALRYDPGFAKARANRGIIRFLSGNKSEGLAELAQTVRENPDMYDARLELAGLRRQIGDSVGALADVREALQRAPADWSKRAEATKFEQTASTKAGLP